MHACIWTWSCDYQIDDRRKRANRKFHMKKDSKREEAIRSHIKKRIYSTLIIFLITSSYGFLYMVPPMILKCSTLSKTVVRTLFQVQVLVFISTQAIPCTKSPFILA